MQSQMSLLHFPCKIVLLIGHFRFCFVGSTEEVAQWIPEKDIIDTWAQPEGLAMCKQKAGIK